MRALRTILCWLMALEAVVCFWGGSLAAGRAAELTSQSATGPALEELATAAPIMIVGIVFATFCVAFWRKTPSARRWGMVAGGANALFAAMFLLVVRVTVRSQGNGAGWMRSGVLWADIGMLAVGLATMAAFWHRTAEAAKKAAAGPAKNAGDGTHPLVDKLVWVVCLAALVAGMEGWWRWSRAVQLPQAGWLPTLIDGVMAGLAMVLVHDLGHILMGKAVGMRVRAFVVGPWQWREREGRWRFYFRPKDVLATGGATALVPTDPRQPKGRLMAMIAAGPAASLVTGLLALGFLLAAPGHAWAGEWALLALFATFSLTAAVMHLAPFRTRTGYSDGALLVQLLSGGAWGDYQRAVGMAGAMTLTAMRPRDLDILGMDRAAGGIRKGVRAVRLRLMEFGYYVDSGQMREASRALNEAQEAALGSEDQMPAEFDAEFVFGKALVQRDAEGTRAWWERLEAKQGAPRNANYWLARAASLWMEGKTTEAKEAWERGNVLAQRLPAAGAYEAARDRYAMLRRELDADRRVLRWHDDPALTR